MHRSLAMLATGPLVALLLLWSRTGAAVERPAYDCQFTDLPVTVDGRLDEPAWREAAVIDRFSLPWLGDHATQARKGTRARLLWDREHLYLAVDMDDDLKADVKEHDGGTSTDDSIALVLKPSDTDPGSYAFQLTPANVGLDIFFPRRGQAERSAAERRFHVTAAATVRGTIDRRDDRDEGWTVEMRIPWIDLLPTGGRPEPGDEWRFTLCRSDHDASLAEPEVSTAAPLKSPPQENFDHEAEEYAVLRFGTPRPQSGGPAYGIGRYVPLTTNKVVGAPEPPPPYVVEPAFPGAVMDAPIVVAAQPGSDLLLVATEPAWGLPSKLVRTRGPPAAFEPETLIEVDDPERALGTVHYSITFHPDFATNGWVFIGANGRRRPDDADPRRGQPGVAERMTRITRYRIDPRPPYTFHADSARLIIEWDSNGHDGGDMAFGADGMLYVTSGDGTSDSDGDLAGQDLGRLRAKVLRIDVDHPEAQTRPAGQAYLIPPDNPFVGQEGVRPETWAYGLRNPWRITCDRPTGQIWVGNNGQDLWEQVYLVERGANYGWSIVEGGHPFAIERKPGPHPIAKPTLEHSHAEARSLTGGLVYRGDAFPELEGCYLYGDYLTGRIWAARHDGERVVRHDLLADTTLQITSFCVDARGEILISDHQAEEKGGIYRLARRPRATAAPHPFPTRLSESGLFAKLREHAMAPGVLPYAVNSPLWSDGTHKVRFLALPARVDDDGTASPAPIDVTDSNGWKFPDGTVLVKSFAIDEREGDPASRRWIETRFMLKEAGDWAGYSYEWNDEQTDGLLVEAAGKDRAFAIRSSAAPDGTRTLAWRYPSRAECMVCHSRAANFALGLCTVQLNRDFDYDAVLGPGHAAANQLRSWEHLGMLRSSQWGDAISQHRAAIDRDLPEELTGPDRHRAIEAALARLTAPLDPKGTGLRSRHSRLLARAPEATNRLADPHDASTDLAARARSYLQSNCSSCHQPAGGGNAMFNALYRGAFHETPLEKAGLVGATPMHHTFDIPEARLVAAGSPERSIVLSRMSRRGPGQMPQLATTIVDERALDLVRRWIESLPTE